MGHEDSDAERGATYSPGAVARLTGLTLHTLRAWERRYGAVRPSRSAGGTRRYTERDLARLQLLAEAVARGHRISELARLEDDAVERLLAQRRPGAGGTAGRERILEAVGRLDQAEVERLLGLQLAALGAVDFARDVAAPLLREVGERWEQRRIPVAAEHLVTAVARSLLGAVLRGTAPARGGARLLFTTPAGELHELGALLAAVVAGGSGLEVVYLGPDLPVGEVVGAAKTLAPAAVGVSVVCLEAEAARRYLETLRRELPPDVALWVGGAGAVDVPGVERIDDLDRLQRRLRRLA